MPAAAKQPEPAADDGFDALFTEAREAFKDWNAAMDHAVKHEAGDRDNTAAMVAKAMRRMSAIQAKVKKYTGALFDGKRETPPAAKLERLLRLAYAWALLKAEDECKEVVGRTDARAQQFAAANPSTWKMMRLRTCNARAHHQAKFTIVGLAKIWMGKCPAGEDGHVCRKRVGVALDNVKMLKPV